MDKAGKLLKTGKMAPRLREFSALPENPNSVLRTHMEWLTIPSSPGNTISFPGFHIHVAYTHK